MERLYIKKNNVSNGASNNTNFLFLTMFLETPRSQKLGILLLPLTMCHSLVLVQVSAPYTLLFSLVLFISLGFDSQLFFGENGFKSTMNHLLKT